MLPPVRFQDFVYYECLRVGRRGAALRDSKLVFDNNVMTIIIERIF
jgi:hypothetical protein